MMFLRAMLALLSLELPSAGPAPAAAPTPFPETTPIADVPRDDPAVPHPRLPLLRTIVETSFVLGVGTLWYWRKPSVSDWDLRFSERDWKSKLFTVNDVVLDDNRFATNGLVHPVSGAVYYQIARGNGFGPGASFLSSALASTFWEYFTEFKEKPSTNDLVLTPMGSVIGEATYRLGRMFAAGQPSIPNCIGALVFSLVATLNEEAVCRSASGPPYDGAGLSRSMKHRLDLGAGETFSRFDGGPVSGDLFLDFAARVVANPAYGRSGEDSVPVHAGQWTSFVVESLLSHGSLTGLWLHADMVWWGRYRRAFALASQEPGLPPDGRGVMLGLGSTFDYDTRVIPWEMDRVVTAGILGPRAEFTTRRGRLGLRGEIGAEYGFSIVTSLAYPFAAPSLAGQEIKSELWQQGYYYAQSFVGRVSLEGHLGSVVLSASARLMNAWSIDRNDRYQSAITNNVKLFDQRTWVRTAATLPIFGGPLNLMLMLERNDRTSRIPGFGVLSVESRGTLSLVARM